MPETVAGREFFIQITAPGSPSSFAQLVSSLSVGDEIVWNGREEPLTVTEIVEESSSPGGLGRFEKRLVVENESRSNGGKYRLSYQDETERTLGPGDGIDARCYVQRHVGEDGNRNGWGRSSSVDELAHVNPVESYGDKDRLETEAGA